MKFNKFLISILFLYISFTGFSQSIDFAFGCDAYKVYQYKESEYKMMEFHNEKLMWFLKGDREHQTTLKWLSKGSDGKLILISYEVTSIDTKKDSKGLIEYTLKLDGDNDSKYQISINFNTFKIFLSFKLDSENYLCEFNITDIVDNEK